MINSGVSLATYTANFLHPPYHKGASIKSWQVNSNKIRIIRHLNSVEIALIINIDLAFMNIIYFDNSSTVNLSVYDFFYRCILKSSIFDNNDKTFIQKRRNKLAKPQN